MSAPLYCYTAEAWLVFATVTASATAKATAMGMRIGIAMAMATLTVMAMATAPLIASQIYCICIKCFFSF
jgi:hypothetical protein